MCPSVANGGCLDSSYTMVYWWKQHLRDQSSAPRRKLKLKANHGWALRNSIYYLINNASKCIIASAYSLSCEQIHIEKYKNSVTIGETISLEMLGLLLYSNTYSMSYCKLKVHLIVGVYCTCKGNDTTTVAHLQKNLTFIFKINSAFSI